MRWAGRIGGAVAVTALGATAGVGGALPAQAATTQLTRAPYLTDVVGSVATVNWGTDSTGTATVTYGPTAAGCTGATASGTATPITVATRAEQQWHAQITGLSPATSYCYSISQDGTSLLTSSPHFTSALAVGSSAPFSFAVLGDWGEATNGVNTDQQKVLELVAKSGVQFALGTGDIGYGDASQTDYGDLQNTGGNSEVFRSGFWDVPGGSVPMFSTIGNHGWNGTFLQNWPQPTAVSSSSGTYSLNAAGEPEAWYAFDEGNARFYVLEAAAGTSSTQYADDDAKHWTSNSPQVSWLKNDLATHPGALKVAVFHYPLWSDELTDSDTLLQRDLLPILDQYGVRLAFNGHSHIYERNNVYTGGTVNGLVSYVSGGAGADTEDVTQCSSYDAYAIGWSTSGSSCHAPVPTSGSQVHHFLKVTVDGSTVTVTPTDENGNVFDQQTYNFAPSAPTGLTATAGNSHVALAWSAPASSGGSTVTGYTVYRGTSNSATGTPVASVGATSYDDTTAAPGTTYYYSVRATNAAGLAGVTSAPVDATPYAAPGAPSAINASPGNGTVGLTWTPPAANGSPISGYTVYRSTDGSRGSAIATPTTASYTDTGLTNGTTYYYTVTATNAAGPGPDSSQAPATPRAVPAAPTGVAAASHDQSVSVTWSAPTDSGGSPVTSYNVYRSTDGSRGSVVSSPTTTSFNDTGLANGTTYYYTVTAVNAVGQSPDSNQASATPRTTPAPPTEVLATPNNGAVSLTWTAPTDNGGSAVTGYGVYRSTDGTLGGLVGTPAAASFNDTGLTNGTTYYYTVKAVNAAGESTGVQVSAVPRTKPAAPTGLTATPQNTAVALTWTAPTNDGGAPITGYTVYRSTTEGTLGSPVSHPTGASYADTGRINGTTYYYTVTATNVAGEGSGSTQMSATPRAVPDAPSSVTATPSVGSVGLTWTAPANNGNPITGYSVFRSIDGSRGSAIATPTTPSFTDTGLTNGTTYYYTISATNAAGSGPDSDPVFATPRTTPAGPTGVAASPGNATVALTWGAPTDNGGASVTGYTVYRSTTSGTLGAAVSHPSGTSYDDAGLSNGVTYFYTVTAANVAGEGPGSGQVSASPATTPAAPLTLTATATDRRVDLSWSPPPDDGGRPVTSYAVYRSIDGTTWSMLTTTAATSTTDDAVADGVTYDYAVTAFNSVGEGVRSAAVSAMPHGGATVAIRSAPSSPTNRRSATFAFDTTDPNGLPITTSCSVDGAPAVPCTSGQTFGGLLDGAHTMRVSAHDSAGPGGEVGYLWVVDGTAPTATLSTLPVVSLGPINVGWSAIDMGTGVLSYDVRFRRAGRDGRFGGWTYPSAWQGLTASTLTRRESQGYTDCFAVRARDVAGNASPWTAPRCTTRPLDDRALTASRGWSRQADSRSYAGTVTASGRKLATLTTGVVGATRIALIATKCRSCGTVRVLLAGRLVGTVSLRASRITRSAVLWLPVFSRRAGTLTIQVATSGRLVHIDGVAAIP